MQYNGTLLCEPEEEKIEYIVYEMGTFMLTCSSFYSKTKHSQTWIEIQ